LADERPLKLGEVLGILRDAAQALAALHATGAVHGAVCAENIVLDERGAARLCKDTLYPPRVSPEQRRGDQPGVRSDVYGLGAAIADLLSGVAKLPEPFERLLAKMLAEEPVERYQSMDEVLAALRVCELMTGYRAFRPGQEAEMVRSRRRLLCVVVLALSALMLVLAMLMVFGETPPRRGKPPESGQELKKLLDDVVPIGKKPKTPAKR